MNAAKQNDLSWYLDHIKDEELLTADEEKELSRRIREESDVLAREQMIQANLRLVVKIVQQYRHTRMTMEDLVAEGNLGLMRACEEFDPDAGVRFSTYAAWWIHQSVKKALINCERPIHVPAYMSKLVAKWRRAQASLTASLGREPTTEEVVEELHISMKKADMIDQGLAATGTTGLIDSESPDAISELATGYESESPDQGLLDASDGPIVAGLLDRLDERKRKVLELRFGLDGHDGPQRTYKEIGLILNLTRERVRQLERDALKELRRAGEKLA
jgi:RNA polymerase primary sigma factor